LAGDVEMVVEIGDDEFPNGSIDRRTITQSRKIGFCEAPVLPLLLEGSDGVAIIANSADIN
jgi:hypothetical protein